MILLDANLLLYAWDARSPHQPAASDWLTATLESETDVRIATVTALAFIRIATDLRVFERPMTSAEAIGVIEAMLARPNVTLVGPTARHWSLLARVAADGQARGPMVMDAHLATLAMEHGARLATTDRDFRRFSGVRTVDPLARAR